MKKQLETFEEMQRELISQQEQMLQQVIEFNRLKLKFYIEKNKLIPVAVGRLKSTGEKCLIYGKKQSNPAIIDIGAKMIMNDFDKQMKKAQAEAIPKTVTLSEQTIEENLDESDKKVVISTNEFGKKEFTMKKEF